jgi:hypothetical protein
MPDIKRYKKVTEQHFDYWIHESVKDKRFEECFEIESEVAT